MAPNFYKAFTPRRFGQLLLRDLAGGYRSMLVAMAAVGGSIILYSAFDVLIKRLGVPRDDMFGFHYVTYQTLLFLGGFIITSLAFREARQNGSGIFYLTIPASAFEKFASKLLATSAGYAVGSAVFYAAVAAASEGINRLVFGLGHTFFNPFNVSVLEGIGYYLVAQSIFLLGSIWWRKSAFLKTWGLLMAVPVGIGVLMYFTTRIAFGWNATGVNDDWLLIPGWQRLMQQTTAGYGPLVDIARVVRVVFLAGTAPVCWTIGWLRLRDLEV